MTAFADPRNPAWRKAGRDEGFRITGRRGAQWEVRRVSRHVGQVRVPKAGWVRFRWSRAVPAGVKSYRVRLDRAGRWHAAFAAVPEPVPAPGNGRTQNREQARYRRLARRIGKDKAQVAISNTQLTVYHKLLSSPGTRY